MSLLTGSELIEEVVSFMAGRDDISTARLLRSLNLSQEHIEQLYEPDELESVQTGTLVTNAATLNLAALPVVPRRVYSITLRTSDGRSQRLTGYSPTQFDSAFPDPAFYSTNIPMVYTDFGDLVEWFPYPDQAYPYRMRFQKKCVLWTEANYTTLYSYLEGKDQAIIYYALHHLYQGLGEPTKAATFMALGDKYMKELDEASILRKPDRMISSETAAVAKRSGVGKPWADPLIRRIY